MIIKEEHIQIYDIFDRMANIIQDLNNISQYVESGWQLPNSLQSMLGKIYRYEGQTVSEIARIYNIDLKNTTKYVGELEKRQLVIKEKQGRQNILLLTDAGRTLHQSLSSEKAVLLERILEEVEVHHLKTSIEVLDQISELTHDFHHVLKTSKNMNE